MLMFPLQGIVFLVENELLRHTPEDIAQFLYKGEGLNKTAIGDYLGERYLFSCLCGYHVRAVLNRLSLLLSFLEMISTSKFFRRLLTSMSLLIWTSSRPSGELSCLKGKKNRLIMFLPPLAAMKNQFFVAPRCKSIENLLFLIWHKPQTVYLQTIPLELPFAWRSPEDW